MSLAYHDFRWLESVADPGKGCGIPYGTLWHGDGYTMAFRSTLVLAVKDEDAVERLGEPQLYQLKDLERLTKLGTIQPEVLRGMVPSPQPCPRLCLEGTLHCPHCAQHGVNSECPAFSCNGLGQITCGECEGVGEVYPTKLFQLGLTVLDGANARLLLKDIPTDEGPIEVWVGGALQPVMLKGDGWIGIIAAYESKGLGDIESLNGWVQS